VRASGLRSLQPARLDALLALMDPAVRFTRFVERSDPYDGPDGVRAWWEDLLRVFPDFTVEVVQVRDAGELTVNAVRVRGHRLGSETPFAETIWQVGELRAGRPFRGIRTGARRRLSKPAGLRNRRCRGRTSRSSAGGSTLGAGAIATSGLTASPRKRVAHHRLVRGRGRLSRARGARAVLGGSPRGPGGAEHLRFGDSGHRRQGVCGRDGDGSGEAEQDRLRATWTRIGSVRSRGALSASSGAGAVARRARRGSPAAAQSCR
jgi:hypothetical protein